MIEIKDIQNIQKEYRELLSTYEPFFCSRSLTIPAVKSFLSEIKIFWYTKQSMISFILNHIEYEDEIAFLAGNIDINIQNNLHKLFTLQGRHRIINDPFLKISCFYNNNDFSINYTKISAILYNAFKNILTILDEFANDFWILPIDGGYSNINQEQAESFISLSENIFLSLFNNTEFKTLQDFENTSLSYEDIYNILNPNIRDILIVDSYADFSLSIRERISKFDNIIKFNDQNSGKSESNIFSIIVLSLIQQYLDIFITSSKYKIIPYVDSLFIILFHSALSPNFISILDADVSTKCVIAFIAAEHYNFDTVPYNEFKAKIGNGTLIDIVLDKLKASGKIFPKATPSDIIAIIDSVLKNIDLPGNIP